MAVGIFIIKSFFPGYHALCISLIFYPLHMATANSILIPAVEKYRQA